MKKTILIFVTILLCATQVYGATRGRVLQRKDHDRAAPGDTVLLGVGAMAIREDARTFKAYIGGNSNRVIQKGDSFRIAQYRPKHSVSGIFEQVVDEDIITRSSEEAPNYRVSHGDKYITFLYGGGSLPAQSMTTLANGWLWHYSGYDMKVETKPGIVKETLIMRADAPTGYSWTIDSNEPKHLSGYGRFIIPQITAVDANGDSVAVTEKYEWDNGWTFSIQVDIAGAVFPIEVDPSVIIKPDGTAGKDAGMLSSNPTTNYGTATYVDIEGSGSQDTYMAIKFTVPQIGDSTVTAAVCSLYSSLTASAGGDNYIVCRITAYWDESTVTWNSPPAYDSTGSIFPLTRLTTNGWNAISHDTLTNWINNAANDSANWHGFVVRPLHFTQVTRNYNRYSTSDNVTASERPSLVVTYSADAPVAISCSLSVGTQYDTINVHVFGSDTSLVDSIKGFSVSGTDTIPRTDFDASSFGAGVKWGGASANTQYIMLAYGYYTVASFDSIKSNADTIWSMPDFPSLSVAKFTATQVKVTPGNGDNNPSGTTISILDSTRTQDAGHRVWLTTAGDTSNTERFYNTTAWGTVTVSGYSLGDTAIFRARAQNGDSTYFSDYYNAQAITETGFDSVIIAAIDTNKIRVQYDPEAFVSGDSLFLFGYYATSQTDTVWGDNRKFADGVYTDTLSIDSVNAKIYVRVRTQDSTGTRSHSNTDSMRTYSVKPSTVSWLWATDTSGVFTATAHGSMPTNSGYFLWDSVRVAAGSTRVYLHPDSLGYFTTKTYRSIASYNDTIKFIRTDISSGQSIKFSLHAGNVDSTGGQ